MNIKMAYAALGIALAVAATPAIGSAASMQQSPINLNRVEIAQSYGVFNDFLPGIVSVKFTNQFATAATSVVFDLVGNDGGILAEYNDVGAYAPGVSFRHSFPDTHSDPQQRLQVAKVTFADGTTWSAPSTQEPIASAYPAS